MNGEEKIEPPAVMAWEKKIERSVDSLQRIYAVIIALAFNEALKRTFLKEGSGIFDFHQQYFPECIAVLVTAVPFIHGMNRHLDKTLNLIYNLKSRWLFRILLVDFAVFLTESCVIFLMAVSVTDGKSFFQLWLLLLTIDVVWAFSTFLIIRCFVDPELYRKFADGKTPQYWAAVNLFFLIVGVIVIYFLNNLEAQVQLWILMIIAILRSIFDYVFGWTLYFPKRAGESEKLPTDKGKRSMESETNQQTDTIE